jgi:PTS system mannose-specific IIA component
VNTGKGVIGIVIVAHGGLAREYLNAVEYLFGRQDGIRAVSIDADHDRAAKQAEIIDAAAAVDTGAGVVVVTDLYGGSPSILSMPACEREDRCIVYGANLPLLIQLSRSRHLGLSEAVERAVDAARKYINVTRVRRQTGI